jgi:hypothetical protein
MQIYLILIVLKYKISTIREILKKLAPSIVISLVMILPWIAGSAAISKSVTYPFEYNSIEMFRSLSKNPLAEILFILIFGYCSYITSELSHNSGIISLLVSALIMAQYSWYNLSP